MLITTKIARTLLLAGIVSVFMQGVAANAEEVQKNQMIIDVSLTSEGSLNGKVVNASHEVMTGSEVVVTQGNKEIVRTATDSNGEFVVKNLNQGVYKIASAEGTGYYRVWETSYAPPAAQSRAMLVSGRQVIRGQAGLNAGTIIGGTAVIAATTFTVIEVTDDDNDDEEVASP